MAPLIALLFSFGLFRLAGWIGFSYFDHWHTSLQAAVAVMLLLTASGHWGKRRPDLIRMVPPAFPRPALIVTVTGLLEIAGAIGIMLPSLSKITSLLLVILLIAMFPANVRAAREGITLARKPPTPLLLRTFLQIFFIVVILLAG